MVENIRTRAVERKTPITYLLHCVWVTLFTLIWSVLSHFKGLSVNMAAWDVFVCSKVFVYGFSDRLWDDRLTLLEMIRAYSSSYQPLVPFRTATVQKESAWCPRKLHFTLSYLTIQSLLHSWRLQNQTALSQSIGPLKQILPYKYDYGNVLLSANILCQNGSNFSPKMRCACHLNSEKYFWDRRKTEIRFKCC